jgi:Domain of unknown function (DUF4178)
MSGNKDIFQYTCVECGHVNIAKGKALTLALTCTKCGLYFYTHSTLNFKFINNHASIIPVGTRGKINGAMYEVMAFTVKRDKRHKYNWHEYALFNPYRGVAFLTQYDGNWNFLKPYSKHPWSFGNTETPEIDKGKFKLYAKYRSEVLFASGEYFADILDVTETSQHFEHINPPYILNFEENNKRLGAYLGEYISPTTVLTAFNLPKATFPKKEGFGYTEPLLFAFKERSLMMVTLGALIAATLIFIFFNNTATNKKVLQANFDSKDLGTQKMFATTSFELEGDLKNLEVKISAPLSNDWFYAEYSLINEATDEEVIFTKELEYYRGTEGGEDWTEGTNESSAFLSSIPGGKYHINIYPEFSLSNHEFTIQLFRDVPFYSNFFISITLLCVFPLGLLIYKSHKEKQRWSESEFGPE